MQSRRVKWEEPLHVAAYAYQQYGDEDMVLLYSGEQRHYSGRYSFFGLFAQEEISDIHALEVQLRQDQDWYAHAWFGYIGYGMRHATETLPQDTQPAIMDLPEMQLRRFGLIIRFDHQLKRVVAYSASDAYLHKMVQIVGRGEAELRSVSPQPAQVLVTDLASNMTQAAYLQKVEQIKQEIAAGTVYQANLTRKFYGSVKQKAGNNLDLFAQLCAVSPSPYSAFLRMDGLEVLSSSPEQFLHIDANGEMATRPIKGTAPRYQDRAQDDAARAKLAESEKDRAENLMIVDLMRHDLARSARVGSVQVPHLFEVMRHPTIHHMSSTIVAQKRSDYGIVDVLRGAFPPGSMTGAPKIKAMELCTALEAHPRGVYSGTILWCGGDGVLDSSVVIRTLIMRGEQFEFQVGGGIVYDSDSISEWHETLDKATAITRILGLKRDDLAAL